MADIIDGKAFAQRLRDFVRQQVAEIKGRHRVVPGLATVLVGADPASEVYVRNKARQTVETGMASFRHELDAGIAEVDLRNIIAQLNADEKVHGILVQLPLPAHLDAGKVIDAIVLIEDVDGFHVSNVGMLAAGQKAELPCTPLGSIMMLRDRFGSLKRLERPGGRPLQHCRQADGTTAAGRRLHGHSRASLY
jgi:methylenetetrahydrofolate dehydrogenase (NADP+) / methenyltetrahydrofolate cyclohydrolase